MCRPFERNSLPIYSCVVNSFQSGIYFNSQSFVNAYRYLTLTRGSRAEIRKVVCAIFNSFLLSFDLAVSAPKLWLWKPELSLHLPQILLSILWPEIWPAPLAGRWKSRLLMAPSAVGAFIWAAIAHRASVPGRWQFPWPSGSPTMWVFITMEITENEEGKSLTRQTRAKWNILACSLVSVCGLWIVPVLWSCACVRWRLGKVG